ncbi:MAG: PAS domain S-box protein, partial [Chloroflexi bacterium]
MRSGARDYVFKENLSRLRPAVEREVRAAAERKAARVAQGEYLRRLASIFDSALDAVVTMDANGVITDWNPMAETVFGWPKSEVVGRPVADTIMPQRYREAHRRGLRHFLETGEGPALNRRLELDGLHRDGHEFPIELSIGGTPSGHGYVFSAFARDIGERRRAEEAVRRLAATVATSTDAIISADLNGLIIDWNAGAERMYGYAAEDVIGRGLAMIVPDDRLDELRVAIDRVIRGEQIAQLETVRRR